MVTNKKPAFLSTPCPCSFEIGGSIKQSALQSLVTSQLGNFSVPRFFTGGQVEGDRLRKLASEGGQYSRANTALTPEAEAEKEAGLAGGIGTIGVSNILQASHPKVDKFFDAVGLGVSAVDVAGYTLGFEDGGQVLYGENGFTAPAYTTYGSIAPQPSTVEPTVPVTPSYDAPARRSNLIWKPGVTSANLDPEMVSILDEYDRRGVGIRITSGFAQNGHSDKSRHYHGRAIDITPIPGQTYQQLLANINAHPDLVDRFIAAGYKIHDETQGGGKGWSGAHLHIGDDSKLSTNSWRTMTVKDNTAMNNYLSNNANEAYNFFIGKGLSPVAAAGIVGNFMQESSKDLKTTAWNKAEGAFGVGQWRGERYTALSAFASKRGAFKHEFPTQLEFTWHEMNTTHKSALNKLMAATTVEEATDAFNAEFERSADRKGTAGWNNRVTFANQVYNSHNTPELGYPEYAPSYDIPSQPHTPDPLYQFSKYMEEYLSKQQEVQQYNSEQFNKIQEEHQQQQTEKKAKKAQDDAIKQELLNRQKERDAVLQAASTLEIPTDQLIRDFGI